MSLIKTRHVVLIGMMGSGKTSVGTALAEALAVRHVDIDYEIEEETGIGVDEIFERFGEGHFRRAESAALRRVADELRDIPAVISTGGGAVLDEGNRHLIRELGTAVWLRASVETLEQRIGDSTRRPLLMGAAPSCLQEIYNQRRSLYEDLATVVVDVDGRDITETVKSISDLLEFSCEE